MEDKVMKFNSQICTTKEQSERLLALGLKKETADMRYQIQYLDWGGVLKECTPSLEPYPPLNNDRFIPAWSLHRLIEMMPKQVKTPKPAYSWYGEDLAFQIDDDLCIIYEDWGIENEEYRFCGKGFYNSNLYDNIIECIDWLITEGYFNKEYLE